MVAGTFGAYTLRLFPEEYAGYASMLGVGLIAIAYIVNISGNKVIEATATFTAIIKVLEISVLAISGLPTTTGTYVSAAGGNLAGGFGFIAALALSILAYKGFTTITNQGGDIEKPHQNIGRSIMLSIMICPLTYVVLALSVAGGLSIPEIIATNDYALAVAVRMIACTHEKLFDGKLPMNIMSGK